MGATFDKIYKIVRAIPSGKVATYGMVATLAGNSRWSRVVGYALHANPSPDEIPCHRVVNRFGEVSGSFAFGGSDMQRVLLQMEGVKFLSNGRVDLNHFLWDGQQ